MMPRPVHLLLLLAPIAGCAKNGNTASIEMFGVCSVPDTCKFSSGKCDMYSMVNEVVDVTLRNPPMLMVPIEVHNQMVNNANEDTGHVNTNDALVEKVEVSWSVPGVSVSSVTNNLSQTVPADGSSVLGLELLDAGAGADLLAGAIPVGDGVKGVASVKLKGRLGDGAEFETGSYRVAVTVCSGCLASAYMCKDPTQVPMSFCLYEDQWPNSFSCGDAPVFYALGGGVSGQTGNFNVVFNGTSVPIAAADLTWSFPSGLVDGSSWSCSVPTPPLGQTCTVTPPSGTVSGADVTAAISCS